MTSLSIPPLVMAVIAFCAGGYHLLVYARRRDGRQDLAFAMTCLAVGFYDVCCVGNYNSADPQAGAVWQRWQLFTLAILAIALLRFVLAYTGLRIGKLAVAIYVFFGLSALVQLLDRSDLTWKLASPLIKRFQMPLTGWNITYQEVAQGRATDIEAVGLLIYFVFLYWLGLHYYVRVDARRGRPLLVAIVIFLAAICEDVLVSAGFYSFVYTIEYGFLGLVMVMAYALSGELAEAARVRQALRRSEEKLVEEGRFLASVNNLLPDILYIYDIVSRRNVYSNDGIQRVLGYTVTEIQAMGDALIPNLMHPDDLQVYLTRILPRYKTAQDGEVVSHQYRMRHRDGEWLWLDSSEIVYKRCLDGAPQQILGAVRDITERKTREEALRASEDLFRKVFEESGLGMAMSGFTDGHFTRANGAFCKMLGYTEDELKCLTFKDVTHPECHAQDAEAVAKLRDGQTERDRVEKRYLKKNGEVVWASRTLTKLRDADGKSFYALAMIEDITERKHAAEALRASEDRLRQAEKMTAIGQLAGGVAHDFNNQLAAIMGYADMLADRLEEGNLKRQAQSIVVSAQRAADLTQQLLAFSRKGKYLSVPVAAHSLLGEVVSILERSIDKRVRIVQLLKADRSVIVGDPSQLQNALLNVALNARDAMPQGGDLTFESDVVKLDDEFCQKNPFGIPPGEYLCLSVTDTGCGMTDEVKMHLFEPFFTTKKIGQGTGMGLASVYGTVRNHHGAINVYSEVGRGTIVRIYLPLAPETLSPAPADPGRALDRGTARILLVDDEKAVREMAAEMLLDLGYVVATCADGREAVEYYRAHRDQIDLVILDMVMPEMDGRDAFLAMREINPRVRALLSSGYSLNGEAQGILNEGVQGFVGKPYRRAELSRLVVEALAKG